MNSWILLSLFPLWLTSKNTISYRTCKKSRFQCRQCRINKWNKRRRKEELSKMDIPQNFAQYVSLWFDIKDLYIYVRSVTTVVLVINKSRVCIIFYSSVVSCFEVMVCLSKVEFRASTIISFSRLCCLKQCNVTVISKCSAV